MEPLRTPRVPIIGRMEIQFQDCAVTLQGVTLLRIPTLCIGPQQLVHVQGPNGAGKTTFLRALAGEVPVTGTLTVGGARPGSLAARQALIHVPTDAALPEDLQVHEYLRFMAAAWRVPERPVLELAEGLGLTPWLHAWPGVLSRGTRQKVALAAALGLARPVTLLDEPFGTLDRAARQVLREAIRARRQSGGTVVCTTHGDELTALQPTVLLVDGGVVEAGPLDADLRGEQAEHLCELA